MAAALAPDFDVVLYVAALPSVEPNPGCEGNDRLTLALDGWQDAMITAVAATNPRVVVVTRTGGAVLMPWLDSVATVLHTGLTGQESGNALADVSNVASGQTRNFSAIGGVQMETWRYRVTKVVG